MIISDKKTNLVIKENGFYTYTLKGVEEVSLCIDERISCEIICNIEDTDAQTRNIQVKDNSNVHLLWINKTADSKIVEEYHMDNYADARVGYYELENKTSDIKTIYHLDGVESSIDMVSSAISSDRKHYNFESLHHAKMSKSDLNNYEISKEGANYNVRVSGNIEKGAIQSKAHQMTRILTTSENQKSEATPLLLIDENDVEASHANSMGKMDDAYLYYLTSRGIDLAQAKDLLTLSYLMPIVDIIDDKDTKAMLEEDVRKQVGL